MNLATVDEHLQHIYKNCAKDGWLDGQGAAITEETVRPFLELLKKYAEDILLQLHTQHSTVGLFWSGIQMILSIHL